MAHWIDRYSEATGPGARIPSERITEAVKRAGLDGIPVDAALNAELRLIGRQTNIAWPNPPGTAGSASKSRL